MSSAAIDRLQQRQQERVVRWRANMAAMMDRVKERFRVTSMPMPQRFLHRSQRLHPGIGWRATATRLVVARVFQDNVVLARVAQRIAKGDWQGKLGRMGELLPAQFLLTYKTLAASVAAGSVAFPEFARNEALALPSCSDYAGPCNYTNIEDHEVSITLERQRSGQQAIIHAPDETHKTEAEEFELFRDDSTFLKLMQAVAVPLLGIPSHIVMNGLNTTEVFGVEKMQRAVFHRPPGQPLITVSNHAAAVDDPFVISSVLPPHQLLNAKKLRWTLCASDKCFASPTASAFFRSVKVLPLTKGLGVFQEGMDVALNKLNRGDWVHIFPEGSRTRDGELQLFKRGVGRLVQDAEILPLVVPFVHTGMSDIMPIGQKIFSAGKKVSVLVGDPIAVDDLVKKHVEEGLPKAVLYDAITLRVEGIIWKLKKELEELLRARETLLSQTPCERNTTELLTNRMQKIWQFADWEAQGCLPDDAISRSLPTAVSGNECLTPQRTSNMGSTKTSTKTVQEDEGPSDQVELCLTDLYNGDSTRLERRVDPLNLMGFAARGLMMNTFPVVPRPLGTLAYGFCSQLSLNDGRVCAAA